MCFSAVNSLRTCVISECKASLDFFLPENARFLCAAARRLSTVLQRRFKQPRRKKVPQVATSSETGRDGGSTVGSLGTLTTSDVIIANASSLLLLIVWLESSREPIRHLETSTSCRSCWGRGALKEGADAAASLGDARRSPCAMCSDTCIYNIHLHVCELAVSRGDLSAIR